MVTSKNRRLRDAYGFQAFAPSMTYAAFRRSVCAGGQARSALKKTTCGTCGQQQSGWYDRRIRRVRDLGAGDLRICLQFEVRRIRCRQCGKVKSERLEFLADNLALHQAVCVLRRPPLPQHADPRYRRGAEAIDTP
jgi:hypothetical protein